MQRKRSKLTWNVLCATCRASPEITRQNGKACNDKTTIKHPTVWASLHAICVPRIATFLSIIHMILFSRWLALWMASVTMLYFIFYFICPLLPRLCLDRSKQLWRTRHLFSLSHSNNVQGSFECGLFLSLRVAVTWGKMKYLNYLPWLWNFVVIHICQRI